MTTRPEPPGTDPSCTRPRQQAASTGRRPVHSRRPEPPEHRPASSSTGESLTLETWEDLSPFRESFLALFTDPGLQDALRRVGHAVYCWAHEYSYSFPEPPESLTTHELRAAGRELRWLEAYFGLYLGNQYQASDLDPTDTRLSQLAEEIAPELGKLAAKIEAALPPAPAVESE